MLASPGARADNLRPTSDDSPLMQWLDARLGVAARRRVLDGLASWRVGRLTVHLPDGTSAVLGAADAEPHASVRIVRDRFFRRMLLHGDIGVGDAYIDGDWHTDDLALVVDLALRNQQAAPLESFATQLWNLADTWRHRRRKNTASGSRTNIHAHYDLGNEFFALFLDATLAYSSGVFLAPGDTLEAAQLEKFRQWGERLQPRATDHVLEIGSGWGGMALHLARTYGCRVTSITVSAEQQALASARVAAAGLQDRVSIDLRDYRQVEGRFDRIVSIEMIEAVGQEFWPGFFQAIDRVLAPGGRVGIQAITIPDQRFDQYVRRSDWIQKHIFPGGLIPSLEALEEVATRHTGLRVRRIHPFGAHYAHTLRRWRRTFDANWPQIATHGFDEVFRRQWEFYLAYCEAGFATGYLDVAQLTLRRD